MQLFSIQISRPGWVPMVLATCVLAMPLVVSLTAKAGESSIKRVVVMLDKDASLVLSTSQASAADSAATDSLESQFLVSLQEEFRSADHTYAIVTAHGRDQLVQCFYALGISPMEVIETEFTNGPSIGGGVSAGAVAKNGHQTYVIERGVPGISGFSLEKQKEISQGSQSVVEHFGGSSRMGPLLLDRGRKVLRI